MCERLAEYLKKNKISVPKFAQNIGVTRSWVNKMLRGDSTPGAKLQWVIDDATNGYVTPNHWKPNISKNTHP